MASRSLRQSVIMASRPVRRLGKSRRPGGASEPKTYARRTSSSCGQSGTERNEVSVFSRRQVFGRNVTVRSEEHTSELQSLAYLVCRLLLEKKKVRAHTAAIKANNDASNRMYCVRPCPPNLTVPPTRSALACTSI